MGSADVTSGKVGHRRDVARNPAHRAKTNDTLTPINLMKRFISSSREPCRPAFTQLCPSLAVVNVLVGRGSLLVLPVGVLTAATWTSSSTSPSSSSSPISPYSRTSFRASSGPRETSVARSRGNIGDAVGSSTSHTPTAVPPVLSVLVGEPSAVTAILVREDTFVFRESRLASPEPPRTTFFRRACNGEHGGVWRLFALACASRGVDWMSEGAPARPGVDGVSSGRRRAWKGSSRPDARMSAL